MQSPNLAHASSAESLLLTPKPATILPSKPVAHAQLHMSELQELAYLRAHRVSIDEELTMLRALQNKNIEKELEQAFQEGASHVYGHWKHSLRQGTGEELVIAGMGQTLYCVLKQCTSMQVTSYDHLQARRIKRFKGAYVKL